jgi:hypothetical protein
MASARNVADADSGAIGSDDLRQDGPWSKRLRCPETEGAGNCAGVERFAQVSQPKLRSVTKSTSMARNEAGQNVSRLEAHDFPIHALPKTRGRQRRVLDARRAPLRIFGLCR